MMGPSVMWAFSVEGRNLKWLGNAGKPGHFANSARDVLYELRIISEDDVFGTIVEIVLLIYVSFVTLYNPVSPVVG